MQCFGSEFAFDLLNKSQAADCNRFRPLRVSYRQGERLSEIAPMGDVDEEEKPAEVLPPSMIPVKRNFS